MGEIRNCKWCGRQYDINNSTAQYDIYSYCSGRCQMEAKRAKMEAERLEMENRRARAFYKKMGFCPHPSRRELVIGGAVVGEIQYRREKKGNLPPKSGDLPIPSETGW